jgi:hypothetical protein
MLLATLVIAQLMVDVVLGVLVVTCLLRMRAPRRAAPPRWYGELTQLAQEIVAVTGPVLDAVDRGAPPAGDLARRPRGSASGPAHHEAETSPPGAPLRAPLLPGEERLLARLACATREG